MNKGRDGFTLIEVLIAVGLLALLLGVAGADFPALFARTRLDAAGKGLGDHFAFVVSRAYTTGRYHTLVFDMDGGTYWYQEGRQDEEAATELLKRTLGKGVEFTDIQLGYESYTPPGSLSVEISPLGVTSDLLINLTDDKERPLALYLNALVQSVDFYNEHKTYAELQDAPTF